jgi:hypothetical protein
MEGFSLMFLEPVSSCSLLAIRNCCSCSSLTAERRVATCEMLRSGHKCHLAVASQCPPESAQWSLPAAGCVTRRANEP